MNIEELKRLAAPLVKWGADSAWENPDGTATVGYIDEDGNRDPILTVDTTIYDGFEGDSLELAKFYAAANPAAVLELIRQLQAAREILPVLKGLVADIQGLMSESHGVTGLHLNGDVAPWGELEPGGRFERLGSLQTAIELIIKTED